MKFAEEIYPKGTFKGQQTDGAYIDQNLAINLNIYSKKIVDDMHFALIIAGNDSVGNGKTTLATHAGCYLTWQINRKHKVNNTFTHVNMVFKAKELVKRSFELPPYSVIVLDEGDDLTEHGMKDAARELKKYFRKCRQLNQILILILPSFFELPRFYALSRSHCLMNVKFMGEFARGFFDFYGPKQKKFLYLKGKKDWNYDIVANDFQGRFFGSYTFFPNCKEEVELYKKNKYDDMIEDGTKAGKETSAKEQIKEERIKIIKNLMRIFPDTKLKVWEDVLEVSRTSIWKYINQNADNTPTPDVNVNSLGDTYNNIPMQGDDDGDEAVKNYNVAEKVPLYSNTIEQEVINNEIEDKQ